MLLGVRGGFARALVYLKMVLHCLDGNGNVPPLPFRKGLSHLLPNVLDLGLPIKTDFTSRHPFCMLLPTEAQ